jgi:hypothetical protein
MTAPAALTSLTKRLAPGWTHHVTGPRIGALVVGGLSEETDGEGRRSRVQREVDITSYALKACHSTSGRAFVAVWIQQLGASSWKLDMAVRGRHDGEHAPQRLDAGQLSAYAASTSVAAYEQQLALLEAKREETKRKAAATRAARRGGVTELRPSEPTEILEEAA